MAFRRHLLIVLLLALTGVPRTTLAQSKNAAFLRIKAEPTCIEVQKAALAHFDVDREKVRAFRRGASTKAAVPIVEVAGGYSRADLDEDTFNYLEFPGNDPWLTKGAGGSAWDARTRLSWNLPELVFNAEVLDIASLAGMVQGLVKEVTRLYYMRRRLQYDMALNPPADETSRITKEVRLEEMTALMDALTGGWFQEELVRRGLEEASPVPGGKGANELFGE
jgi:hypothetical protein